MGCVQYSEQRFSVMNHAAHRHNFSLNYGVQNKHMWF